MRSIPLPKGFVALVDDEDYGELSQHSWQISIQRGRAYAKRKYPRPTRGSIYMHRVIMGVSGRKEQVDHIKHHPLSERVIDNRRSNLRRASNRLNQANTGKKKRRCATSAFKGVSRMRSKWKASIYHGGIKYHLGHYANEPVAAMVYDMAAVAAFGEFALCNFGVPGARRWLYSGSGA